MEQAQRDAQQQQRPPAEGRTDPAKEVYNDMTYYKPIFCTSNFFIFCINQMIIAELESKIANLEVKRFFVMLKFSSFK